MKRARKLSLSKETLARIDAPAVSDTLVNDSCVDSCYLVSCGGGCGISTALKA